jgi:hypothetical protein
MSTQQNSTSQAKINKPSLIVNNSQPPSTPTNNARKTALFMPDNRQRCRDLLGEAVANHSDMFVQGSSGGPLVVLCIPDPKVRGKLKKKDITWDTDLPATVLAQPAHIMLAAEDLIWQTLDPKGNPTQIHPPSAFLAEWLTQSRGKAPGRILTGLARVPCIDDNGRDRGTARATLGRGLAVSAFPLYVPV